MKLVYMINESHRIQGGLDALSSFSGVKVVRCTAVIVSRSASLVSGELLQLLLQHPGPVGSRIL